jgi:hypothetical protein
MSWISLSACLIGFVRYDKPEIQSHRLAGTGLPTAAKSILVQQTLF